MYFHGTPFDDFHYEVEREEQGIKFTYSLSVSGRFTPGKPPRPGIFNPDHPDFSDPGSGDEIDINKIEVTEIWCDWRKIRTKNPILETILDNAFAITDSISTYAAECADRLVSQLIAHEVGLGSLADFDLTDKEQEELDRFIAEDMGRSYDEG